MKIVRLELFGFKSFKDKTIVTFDQPVTAIIGSNGCGKSNVVDALYWVMGDMSPKHLRGAHMTDVIFSGAKDAAPLDMAEVTMVLSREPGKDPELPPQFQASSEIQITRRYYRSGEGEYLINKVACRLRDIQEFFMDTGVGAKAYSIVEQGAISKMISLKPEDRRVVIEEVAGIMKFKARKAETERKIENSRLNLQRVDDIVADLQKQLQSLKRQADKAERFRTLSEQLKRLEIRLAAREWIDRTQNKSESLVQSEKIREDLAKLEASLADERAKIETLESILASLDEKLGERRQLTRSAELRLKDYENEISNLQTKQEHHRNRIAYDQRSSSEIEERTSEIKIELTDVLLKIDELNQKVEVLAKEIEETELKNHELQQQVGQVRENAQVARKGLHEQELGQTRLTQKLQEWQRNLSQVESKKANLESQLVHMASDLEMREAEKNSTLNDLEKAFATRTELESAKNQVDEDLHRLENARNEIQSRRDHSREELSVARIRKEQLEALERDLDGVEAAAKSLALHLREQGGQGQLLADVVKVPYVLEKATEAILGRNLQRIIASDLEQTVLLREFLIGSDDDKAKQGRAPLWIPTSHEKLNVQELDLSQFYVSIEGIGSQSTNGSSAQSTNGTTHHVSSDAETSFDDTSGDGLAPTQESFTAASPESLESHDSTESSHPEIARMALHESPGPDGLVASATPQAEVAAERVSTVQEYLLTHPQVVGPLDRLIQNELEDKKAPWLGLLKGYWVVRDRSSLMELTKKLAQIPLSFVTLDGDVLYANGYMDLAPVEEVKDAQASGLIQRKRVIADLKVQEASLSEKLQKDQEEFDRCLFDLSQAKEKFRELTVKLSALNPDVEKYSVFLRQVEAQIARLSEKQEILGNDIQSLGKDSLEINQQITALTVDLERTEVEKQAAEDKLEKLESNLLDVVNEQNQLGHQLGTLRASSKQLDREVAEYQNKRAALEQESHLQEVRKTQLQEEIANLEAEILTLTQSMEETEIQRATSLSELRQSKDLEEELEKDLSKGRSELRALQAKVDSESQELSKLTSLMKDLEQNVAIHEVELKNISEKVHTQYQIGLAELAPEQLHDLTQAEDLEEIADAQKAKVLATQLRQKIDNLGKINMVAVEEFEDVKRRYEYLFIQREDLAEGIRQLKDAIDRIDRESKERFGEAFHAVNEAFGKTFPILFGGGNAELRLTIPDNMLETGVEIIAQPPGKKLQSVTLLSGGEKALTAVSLIFGIFSIKPSPFCVLDEVDAPLDDANVGRFNSLVHTITKTSQVIMITHHKKTMESCDALFGVTMEKPGISKVVSVQLGEL